VDLKTTYLGFDLKNPIVAAASPLSREVSNVRALEDAGAAAVVCYSLFEEQIRHETHEIDHYLSYGTDSFAEAASFIPEMDIDSHHCGPFEYLDHIARLKGAVDIPIIASLNGTTPGGWIEYARGMEAAGADAIELNVYYVATDPLQPGSVVEHRYLDVLAEVKRSVRVPVSIKVGPFFSSFAHFARRLDGAGADGLVLFNRFYQPDIDLDTLEVVPGVRLSDSDDLRLPLRWIAILYGQVQADIAATSGVHEAEDVIKMMMVGANSVMMASALLKKGIGHLWHVLSEVEAWMEAHEYDSIQQMRGSMSQQACPDPSAFERANYMQALNSYAIEGGGG
jgi:dihydroorotate dehydrogenase (fumarate)